MHTTPDGLLLWLLTTPSFTRLQMGPVPLSTLGSMVKRPEGVSMKLKAFITTHSSHFKFDDKAQLVSLA